MIDRYCDELYRLNIDELVYTPPQIIVDEVNHNGITSFIDWHCQFVSYVNQNFSDIIKGAQSNTIDTDNRAFDKAKNALKQQLNKTMQNVAIWVPPCRSIKSANK